ISAQRTRTSTGGRPDPANELEAPTSHPPGLVKAARTWSAWAGWGGVGAPGCSGSWNRSPRTVVSTAKLPAVVARLTWARAPKARCVGAGGGVPGLAAELASADTAGLSTSRRLPPSWLPMASTGRPPVSILAGAVMGAGNDPAGKGDAVGSPPVVAGAL